MSEQLACLTTDMEPGTARLAELTEASGADVAVAIIRSDDGDFYAIGDLLKPQRSVCRHQSLLHNVTRLLQ